MWRCFVVQDECAELQKQMKIEREKTQAHPKSTEP